MAIQLKKYNNVKEMYAAMTSEQLNKALLEKKAELDEAKARLSVVRPLKEMLRDWTGPMEEVPSVVKATIAEVQKEIDSLEMHIRMYDRRIGIIADILEARYV